MTSVNTWSEFKKWWRANEHQLPVHAFPDQHLLHPLLNASMELNNSVVGVIDVKQMKYLYLSDNIYKIYGWQKEHYFRDGVEFSFNTCPEKIKKGVNIFSRLINQYFLSLPPDEKGFYRGFFEYAVLSQQGSLNHILQREYVLKPAEDGSIWLKLVLCSNIGNYKADDSLQLRLSNSKEDHLYKFFLHEEAHVSLKPLSRRELVVAQLLSRSYTLKEIAEELSISFSTVKNHSANLLKKFDVRDSVELINLLRLFGFI